MVPEDRNGIWEQKDVMTFNDEKQEKCQLEDQKDFWKCDVEWAFGVTGSGKDSNEVNNASGSENNYIISGDEELITTRTPIFNKFGTLRKKIGRKRLNTGLKQRKDVVLKSLLRKIRHYFWNQLKNTTKYMKQKKRRGIEYYERCLETYIQSELNEDVSRELVFVLGSIASPVDMKELITHKQRTQPEGDQELLKNELRRIDEIYEILYKFSFAKFTSLAKSPEFFKIISNFQHAQESSLKSDEIIGVKILLKAWQRS